MIKRKNIVILAVGFIICTVGDAYATRAALLQRSFASLMRLARGTSGNGLTELPPSTLRDHGARFVGEIEDIVGATVRRVGLERTVLELPGSTTDRIVRESKEEWDAQFREANKPLQSSARTANAKIQRMHRKYEEMLDSMRPGS